MESCVNLPTYLDSFGCPVFICKQNSLQFFLILNFTSMDSYGMHSSGTYFCHSVVWFLDSANMMHLVLVHSSSLLCSIPLFSSVQSLSHVWLFATPWTAARQASLSITNSWSLLKLMSIELVMPSNHLILCHPLLLLPSIFPSIRIFSNESVLHIRWPKDWSFSFRISFSSEYSGLISFRIDWYDLLAVQGTLKSLLQHLRLVEEKSAFLKREINQNAVHPE